MARYQDSVVTEMLLRNLYPGEQLQYWAYGVRTPSFVLRFFFIICLAVIPGLLIVWLLTKQYVVGLTSHRLVVMRVSGSRAEVQEVTEYNRWYLPPSETSTGPIFTHIRIRDPRRPFHAVFHRLGMPNNRQHAMAIAAALPPAATPPYGHQAS